MDSTILFKNNGIVILTFPTTKKWLSGLSECFLRHCVVSTGCYFEKVVFRADFSELHAFASLPCKGPFPSGVKLTYIFALKPPYVVFTLETEGLTT